MSLPHVKKSALELATGPNLNAVGSILSRFIYWLYRFPVPEDSYIVMCTIARNRQQIKINTDVGISTCSFRNGNYLSSVELAPLLEPITSSYDNNK